MTVETERLKPAAKFRLALSILFWYCVVQVKLITQSFPILVHSLGKPGGTQRDPMQPNRLGAMVYRVLRVWPLRARCLVLALVLYKMLRMKGIEAEVVIGLPHDPEGHKAHAWVEVDSVDVGPPPGKKGHRALARYGPRSRTVGTTVGAVNGA